MYSTIIGSYKAHYNEIRSVRDPVFLKEQNVARKIEEDENDPKCNHVIVFKRKKPVGTGRLDSKGKIGRVAVLKEFRKAGIGKLIMSELERKAKELGIRKIHLHAQEQVIPFYEKLNYQTVGDIFYEANIPHKKMEKWL